MHRSTVALVAVVIVGTAGVTHADYLSSVPGTVQKSWTFPIRPGGFIGGMDVTGQPGNPVVVFNEGGSVYNLNNGSPTIIYNQTPPTFASFVTANPSSGRLTFSESLGYSVNSVGVDGSGLQAIGTISGSYDAIYGPDGKLYMTRATSFTGPTQIVVVNEANGALTQIAEYAGPTGPIAFAPDGSLYYGTVSPVFGQAGGQTLYRITSQQITTVLGGGSVLGASDTEVVLSNIDSPSDMLALPSGDILYSSSVGSPAKITRISNGVVSAYATLQDPFLYMTNLAYFEGSVFVNVGGVYGPGFSPFGAIVQIVPEPSSLIGLACFAGSAFALFRRRA